MEQNYVGADNAWKTHQQPNLNEFVNDHHNQRLLLVNTERRQNKVSKLPKWFISSNYTYIWGQQGSIVNYIISQRREKRTNKVYNFIIILFVSEADECKAFEWRK